ncbi:uncharacterized protein L203_104642 [Cryptococcus depauperatus CBS 7841]|uniref:GDP/GTP exchange factor Sec2 N-terminal domain-containing protein n=1 Tax=Cryptococcus depauperatus CBS 7841 TaxID=1295531 RepID=A0A1E3ILG6_9TREE|nr:hypothetical protein L203_02154 [Cryptococcus depauperatus CBS 7841]
MSNDRNERASDFEQDRGPAVSLEPTHKPDDIQQVEKLGVKEENIESVVGQGKEAVEKLDKHAQQTITGTHQTGNDVESIKHVETTPQLDTLAHCELISQGAVENRHRPDSPTTSLITSLKDQLLLLSDQTHALNSKLIASISRSADLEDELSATKDQNSQLKTKARSLEEERDRWEESMKTGLLVERDQIKDEMQRLAAELVEEERRRGSAEERREQVESEVDDLTAKLFDQANTMVATERMSRAQAEARLMFTEGNLANAEAALRAMQLQLQNMSLSPPSAPEPVPSSLNAGISMRRRYISSHVPYTEFLTFLQHIRAAKSLVNHTGQKPPPPTLPQLLAQPFLARILVEDHEPTLRLEAAPALSFLSRRTVGSAIISGDLVIEPMSVSSILQSTGAIWGDLVCGLCGRKVFNNSLLSPTSGPYFNAPPQHPQRSSGSTTSRFSLKPFFNASSSNTTFSNVPSPAGSPPGSPTLQNSSIPTSVFVFRIARSQGVTISSGDKDNSRFYPVCKSGWCLERLRATCETWHFIRTGIVQVVWNSEEGTAFATEIPTPPAVHAFPSENSIIRGDKKAKDKIEPPPLPDRKKSWGIGFNKSGGNWWGSSANGQQSPKESKKKDDDSDVGSLGAKKDEYLEPTIGSIGRQQGLKEEIEKGTNRAETNAKHTTDEIKTKTERPSCEHEITFASKEDRDLADKQETATVLKTSILEEPSLNRSGSSSTLPGSDASFSTPKEYSNELLDVEIKHNDTPTDEDKEDDNRRRPDNEVIDNIKDEGNSQAALKIGEKLDQKAEKGQISEVSSPANPTTPKSVASSTSSKPTTPTKLPPPIPRKSTARDRLSQYKSANDNAASSGLIRDEVKEMEEKSDEVPKSSKQPEHPRSASGNSCPPSRQRVLSNEGHTFGEKEDKTFLPEQGERESWEEKAWKNVITLKENMWKARVGVTHE